MITNYVVPLDDGEVDEIVGCFINNALLEVMTEILKKFMTEYRKPYVSVYDPDFQNYIEVFFLKNIIRYVQQIIFFICTH